MEVRLIVQKQNDTPQLANIRQPVLDLTHNESITFCLVEGGMKSGEPSVLIVSENKTGSVVLQTSLDKFLTSGAGLLTAAETRFGWSRPEGYATIMPLNKEARRALLESLKKELEEWDTVDEGD